MSNLSKTDENSFSMIEPHLKNLQVFLDKNIKGSNSMTAAAIHEKFTECNLDAEDFIKGFRVAVRIGKLTGIEGAQRAGYRRIGEAGQSKSSSDSNLELITPYLDKLQAFVDKHIQGSARMTASVIYEKFKAESGCTLSEDDFIKCFRIALREEKIQGLESAYRFGYKRAGVKSESDDSEEEEEKVTKLCEIIIDDNHRIVALDRSNWGFQSRSNSSGAWVTEGYYGNYSDVVKAMVRKVIDNDIKSLKSFNFKDLEKVFVEAEARLAKLIQQAMTPSPASEPDAEEEERDTEEPYR